MEDRTIAGRYKLTERIGSGGMGVVWRAEDVRLRRVVAVKELLARTGFDQESVDRAVREGRIAARLQHANVIALYDVVEHDGHPWLVMEYLPSRSLATVMSERGKLPAEEVARIGAQLASGLAAAHAAGVVHRDVKPGNVLVTEFGTVKVTDFGTSRAADEVTVTASGMLVGTPAYLSPEVARGGKGEFPADVFALGATLYAAVEGEPPFGLDGNTIALLHRVADGRFPPPANAGPLAPVLMRLLDSDPATRPTMAETARMLQEVRFDGAPVPVPAKAPAATAIMTSLPDPEPTPEPEPSSPAPAARTTPPPRPAAPPQTAPPPPASRPNPPPADPAPRSGDEDRGGNRKALLGLAGVLLVVAVAGLLVWLLNRDGEESPAAQPGTTTTPATQDDRPPADQPQGTTEEQREPTATTTTTTQAEATTTTSDAPAPTPATPDQAISDYYGQMPGNLQGLFARLSDNFKASRGLTYAGYEDFWNDFSEVEASNVQVTGPNTVAATITYTRPGGGREQENHVYTLVQANGQWLIDSQSP
ncbi:serine/threonine-protein kinase [Saccharothrix yanglingensis]|nr:serine/threonine-protein kinase [Saccharothrix yanglingensis]